MLRIRRTSLTNMSVAGNESHLNYGMFPPGGKCRRGLDKEFEGLKCKQETLSAFETEKQNISFLERNKFFSVNEKVEQDEQRFKVFVAFHASVSKKKLDLY